MKGWVLKIIIRCCDWLLENQDCADDQNEINEIIATRNWALRESNND
jgi:hypothetical protein